MHNIDGDQIHTEQRGKLYVRYNKPQALKEQNKGLRSELNNEVYLKVLASSQRNLVSDLQDDGLDKCLHFQG